MAASTVARSLLAFLFIAFIAASTAAETVSPSNATLPTLESGLLTTLELLPEDSLAFQQSNYQIVPLTEQVGLGSKNPTAVSVRDIPLPEAPTWIER
jgi:hypothetical protein